MTYKSLNDLPPLYLKNLFTCNSHCSSRALGNTQSNLKLTLRKTSSGQIGQEGGRKDHDHWVADRILKQAKRKGNASRTDKMAHNPAIVPR